MPFTVDQRGLPRLGNGLVDIGAAETSVFVVTNTLDAGIGSLRQQVAAATDVTNTITFDPSLAGNTILFTSGEIVLARNVVIDATALPTGLTLNGNNSSRLFFVNGAQTVVLAGLTLTGGNGVGTSPSGAGGAIYNSGGNLTLNQCTLANNAATGTSAVGGAIRHGSGTLTLNRCTIANNTSSASGSTAGGIGIAAGSATLNQCTLSGNSAASSGGALKCNSGAALTLTQCTVAGNMAGTSGGGLNNQGTTNLTNSIVAGNSTSSSGFDLSDTGAINRAGANIIGSNSGNSFPAGFPNVNGDYVGTTTDFVNALLAPLDNYGGPTKTMALEPGSPARDVAAVLSPAVTSDQRGFPIVGTPDIGAYEAGTLGPNYNAYIWESLPATATAAQHAAGTDFDGDGVSNYNEWLALTNPADNTSYLHFTQFNMHPALSNGEVDITFPSAPGRTYQIQFSTNLTSWTTLESGIAGGGPISRTYTYTNLFTRAFYRLSVSVGP
jgi:hypothetical protein